MSILSKIAEEAGVSAVTASRVLNGKHVPIYRKARQRAEHIKQIAQRLRYRPNAAARATVTGKFSTATLLLPGMEQSIMLLPGVVEGLCDELAEHDHQLMVSRMADPGTSDGIPKVLREVMTDGLFFHYNDKEIPTFVKELIRLYHIPSIYVNYKFDADCVYPDDFTASRAATSRLIRMGHRRIAYALFTPSQHYSAPDRRNGCVAAMREAGFEPVVLEVTRDEDIAPHRARLYELMKGPDRPTAAVCYAQTTTEVLLEVASTLGLRVPQDLSLIQFDSEHVICGRQISTVILPWYEVGRKAAANLLVKIDNPSLVLPPLAVMPNVDMVDRSTCPPGGA